LIGQKDTEESLKEFVPGYEASAPGSQRIGIAFLADCPAEVDALYDGLVSHGHEGESEPWDAVWGQRYAVVKDPDGNAIDLFAPLSSPGSPVRRGAGFGAPRPSRTRRPDGGPKRGSVSDCPPRCRAPT
jgi:hypothetical protein